MTANIWLDLLIVGLGIGTIIFLRHKYLQSVERHNNKSLYGSTRRDTNALTAADKWLIRRHKEIMDLAHKIDSLASALRSKGLWDESFAALHVDTSLEGADYLAAIEKDPIGWARTSSQHYQGPYTTVPINTSGWMSCDGNSLVDAHMELFIVKAENVLALHELAGSNNEREIAYQQAFKVEIDKCIEKAGLNRERPDLPVFATLNIVREITGCDYVRLNTSPVFFVSLAEVLLNMEVAKDFPDGRIFMAPLFVANEPSEELAKECMDNLGKAMAAPWRKLSSEEVTAVLNKVELVQ